MGESMWGRFSALTDQISQLTREVMADDEDQEEHLDASPHNPSLDDEDFDEGADVAPSGGGSSTEEVARLKAIIASQKREVLSPLAMGMPQCTDDHEACEHEGQVVHQPEQPTEASCC